MRVTTVKPRGLSLLIILSVNIFPVLAIAQSLHNPISPKKLVPQLFTEPAINATGNIYSEVFYNNLEDSISEYSGFNYFYQLHQKVTVYDMPVNFYLRSPSFDRHRSLPVFEISFNMDEYKNKMQQKLDAEKKELLNLEKSFDISKEIQGNSFAMNQKNQYASILNKLKDPQYPEMPASKQELFIFYKFINDYKPRHIDSVSEYYTLISDSLSAEKDTALQKKQEIENQLFELKHYLETDDNEYLKQLEDSLKKHHPEKYRMFKELRALHTIYEFHNSAKKKLNPDKLDGEMTRQKDKYKNTAFAKLYTIVSGIQELNIGNYLLSYSPLSIEYLPVDGFNISYNLTPQLQGQFSYGNMVTSRMYIIDGAETDKKNLWSGRVKYSITPRLRSDFVFSRFHSKNSNNTKLLTGTFGEFKVTKDFSLTWEWMELHDATNFKIGISDAAAKQIGAAYIHSATNSRIGIEYNEVPATYDNPGSPFLIRNQKTLKAELEQQLFKNRIRFSGSAESRSNHSKDFGINTRSMLMGFQFFTAFKGLPNLYLAYFPSSFNAPVFDPEREFQDEFTEPLPVQLFISNLFIGNLTYKKNINNKTRLTTTAAASYQAIPLYNDSLAAKTNSLVTTIDQWVQLPSQTSVRVSARQVRVFKNELFVLNSITTGLEQVLLKKYNLKGSYTYGLSAVSANHEFTSEFGINWKNSSINCAYRQSKITSITEPSETSFYRPKAGNHKFFSILTRYSF